jgi:7,8-dihydro-6-hydroxymethylpterin dimethyltransferase
MPELLRSTQSLCPVCLTKVSARLLEDGDDVLLEASCAVHGEWRTVTWAGPPSFRSWCGDDPAPAARQTCTAVVEVTRGCDLGCPVCFAESPPRARANGSFEAGPYSAGHSAGDPSAAALGRRFTELFAAVGEVNIQLSGGEPTTRNDLPETIAAAADAGFTFVQLNTNGLRLAAEVGYAENLRQAGLASVFLQFDGLLDSTYRALRGRPLLHQKVRAVERCAEAGLAVVLVPTVVPGVNDTELGELVHFASSWPGVVRGLHLQPISYFGRYPGSTVAGAAAGRPRLTLPELLRALDEQTAGTVRPEHFSPSCCEHVRCSFRARYWVREGGVLEPVRAASCCCGAERSPAAPPEEAPRRAVAATSRQWSRREPAGGCCAPAGRPLGGPGAPAAAGGDPGERDDLSRFLDDANRILAISGMLFQDAWTIDMERIQRCCVQVVTPPSERAPAGLVPFCLWNLTSVSGERLYPR